MLHHHGNSYIKAIVAAYPELRFFTVNFSGSCCLCTVSSVVMICVEKVVVVLLLVVTNCWHSIWNTRKAV